MKQRKKPTAGVSAGILVSLLLIVGFPVTVRAQMTYEVVYDATPEGAVTHPRHLIRATDGAFYGLSSSCFLYFGFCEDFGGRIFRFEPGGTPTVFHTSNSGFAAVFTLRASAS